MKTEVKPGEMTFAVLLLLLSAVIFAVSAQMFAASSYDVAGYGGLPALMSLSMTILMLKVLIDTKRNAAGSAPTDGGASALSYVLSKDVVVFLLMTIGYCAALNFGVPFIAATPVYMMASMQYLMSGGTKFNAVYTACVTAGVYLIFVEIFHVSLP